MKPLDKWVDVRKKQTREVTNIDVTIVKDENLNAYITLKEVKDLTHPYKTIINGRWITKLDKNYTVLEYTPLDKLYNVRVHINDKLQIIEYYFDIILQNEIRKIDGIEVPFYNDLYLDVIYYQKIATRTSNFIMLDDRDELRDALKEGKIDQQEYDLAYEVANSLMKELLEGKNVFVNRGLKDYFKYRKNIIEGVFMKENILKSVTDLTLYTGTYGRKKCTCSCIGCTQQDYGRKHKDYQGNLEQIKVIIEKLPNLENAYLLGNPDVSVDTLFCNKAAKEFIKAGKKVMFSTSGYDGLNVIKKLTDGIDSKNIGYISYSIDTIDNKKLQYLKGSKKINLDEINEAIKYCLSKDITVKIQPTIWEINQDDYKDIIDYYSKIGIEWFTFHAGSFEALQGRDIPLNHVKPKKWMEIVKEINSLAISKNLKMKAPKIFLNDDEWKTYKQENKVYCQNGGRGLQIWMQSDGLKATFCPLLSEVMPEITFDLEKEKPKILHGEKNNCIVCSKCIDNKLKDMSVGKHGKEFLLADQKIHNVCRYYS